MITYYMASWCKPCAEFKPTVERVAKDLNLQIEYVDIESADGLMRGLNDNVTSVPTLVVDKRKLVGAVDESVVRNWINV